MRFILLHAFFIISQSIYSLSERRDPLTVEHNSFLYETILQTCCEEGNLPKCYRLTEESIRAAPILLIRSTLELILFANVTGAVFWRREGKALNSSALPPLALLHMNGNDCGGLGDIFYVSAIMIQTLSASDDSLPLPTTKLIEIFSQLITLLADSGLQNAVEVHLRNALSLHPQDGPLLFRAALATPGVYESLDHIIRTRKVLEDRILHLKSSEYKGKLKQLDEFVLSPTFYFVYQGYNDREILSNLHIAYAKAHPSLHKKHLKSTQPEFLEIQREEISKINVGFVSRHFRRHSICKLFCGILTGLDSNLFNVFAFSALQETSEDAYTAELRSKVSFISVGSTFINTRQDVLDRNIDVLVYLDVGMDPSTVAWAAARLAPIQVCTWGHPTTTGLRAMDYYISSLPFHETEQAAAQDRFLEQLVLFDSLGYFFIKSILHVSEPFPPVFENNTEIREYGDQIIRRPQSFYSHLINELKRTKKVTAGTQDLIALIEDKAIFKTVQGIILCPQHLPKFHPYFDRALLEPLIRNSAAVIAVITIEKKFQWRRTLTQRWRNYLLQAYRLGGGNGTSELEYFDEFVEVVEESAEEKVFLDGVMSRVRWLHALSPSEYLTLLAVGDVMVDPFPFGGGVTTLEALAVCTPVVTLPSKQTVPELAGGMLKKMELSSSLLNMLVVRSVDAYIRTVDSMLTKTDQSISARREICGKNNKVFEQNEAVEEWGQFLLRAYHSAK